MVKKPKCPIDDATQEGRRRTDGPGDTMRAMDRRRFLGTMAAVGGTVLLGGARRAEAAREFAGHPDRFGMLVDTTACVGCRSCEKACNAWNNLSPPDVSFDESSVFENERRTTEKAYTVVNRYSDPGDEGTPVFRKVQCMHCNEPACATACPIHAYTKTKEGATLYDEEKCFGCRYCMTACPFNIPAYDYWSALEPKIVKCTFCYDRISQGRRTACSEACPAGALTFGKRADLIVLARKKIMDNPGRYMNHIYGETEVGGTSWLYLSGIPFDQIGLPTDLPSRPLIEETKGFLSAVPVVFTVWPALFGMMYAASRHREQHHDDKEARQGEEVES